VQSEKQEGVPLSFSLSLLVPLLINLIFPLSSFSQTEEETLTITTYYPAPYGVYNEMRAKRMAVGANYYNGSAFPWNTGGVCMGNEICKNTDLVVQGRVGIGTTRPANKLDVEGAMAVGATYSGTSAGPTNGMIIEGNVGIGTMIPAARLDVAGDINLNGNSLRNVGGMDGCQICLECQVNAGVPAGGQLPARCIAVNGGWSDWTGDSSNNSEPDSDNARCRIKLDCTG